MRLFLALELSDPVRAGLSAAQQALGRSADGVRWIPAGQLHLTVKFLGEVPDSDVAEVAVATALAAQQSAPFSMRIEACGCFPPRGAVRIVWAGVHEVSGSLERCVHAVEDSLEGIGFPRETKPFSPHITIGRVREDRSAGRIRSAVAAGTLRAMEQPVEFITLMSSVLSPKGPTYSAVSRANLGEREVLK